MATNAKSLTTSSQRLLALPDKERQAITDRWSQIKSLKKPFDERKAMLSLVYNNASVIKLDPQTIEQVVNNRHRTLSIGDLVKYRTAPVVLSYIIIAINEELVLSDTARDIRNDDNQKMLLALCQRIIDRYHRLTISDLKLCIRMGYEGQFKTRLFDRMDGALIIAWIGEYIERKKQIRLVAGNFKPTDTKHCTKAPKEFTQRTHQLAKKMSVAKNIRYRKYTDLLQYCTKNNIDAAAFLTAHEASWQADYEKHKGNGLDLSFERYKEVRASSLLAELNKNIEENK